MARTKYVLRLFLIITTALGCPLTLAADQKSTKSDELRQLQSEIKRLRSNLDQARDKQQSVRKELSGLAKDIKTHLQLINNTDDELRLKGAELKRLQAEKTNQQIALREYQQRLRQQLLIAYAGGNQELVKILLNGDNPATIGRALIYHRYLSQAQAKQVVLIKTAIERVDTLSNAIEHQTQALQQLRAQRVGDQAALQKKLAKHKTLLVQLDSEIGSKQQRLQRLVEDEKRLETLLRKLELAKRNKRDAKSSAFSALKGKLSWPITGKLNARFGTTRQLGEKKWQGVLIRPTTQQDVKAVANGLVVFADELRGFGLLLIVDHGGNYLSLYGHNSSLRKKAGNKVRAGEAIGAVSPSAEPNQSGLYFEIRHKGKPVDPALWCAGRP